MPLRGKKTPKKNHTDYNFHGSRVEIRALDFMFRNGPGGPMDKGSISFPVLTQSPTKIGHKYGKVWKSGGRERQHARGGRTKRIEAICNESQ